MVYGVQQVKGVFGMMKKTLIGLVLGAVLLIAQYHGPAHVTYSPLGIWPLCDAGIIIPGCTFNTPHLWLEITYRDVVGGGMQVIGERIVEKPGVWR